MSFVMNITTSLASDYVFQRISSRAAIRVDHHADQRIDPVVDLMIDKIINAIFYLFSQFIACFKKCASTLNLSDRQVQPVSDVPEMTYVLGEQIEGQPDTPPPHAVHPSRIPILRRDQYPEIPPIKYTSLSH